ncbi:MAG: hypothetical protein IJO63_03080 [Bacilli bacterium]|nr:hypothetical protein [Bacilli bacterium]
MKVFKLSEKDFLSLEKLIIGDGVVNTMAELYHMPKDADELLLVFKRITVLDDEYFANKVETIVHLMEQEKERAIPALVYPKGLVTIDGDLAGFAMPLVKGTNLKTYLNDPKVSYEKKKQALIQVGNILKQMKACREETSFNDFYLNDIHEGNFIIEDETGMVRYVDLDSCAIRGNDLDRSMYLRPVAKFRHYEEKYKYDSNGFFGSHIVPSDDTEIFSYTSMILNFIAKDNLGCLNPGQMLEYIAYLEDLGYPFDILCNFITLYSKTKPNVNPVDLLEHLEFIPRSTYTDYLYSRRKF